MIEGKFDVVFRGQIVKSLDEATVKQNLVKLFKSTPDAIDKLFTGQEMPIRKALDYTAAMKYQSALRSAGALALIKEIEQEQPKIQAKHSGKASFSGADETTEAQSPNTAAKPEHQASEASASSSNSSTDTSQETVVEGDLSLAEAGTQLMPDKVYEKREVDTSDLSLAAAGERLLPKKEPEVHAEPKIDHLSITNDTSPIGGES